MSPVFMSIRPGKAETAPVAAIYPPDHATGTAISGENDGTGREMTGTGAADEVRLRGRGKRRKGWGTGRMGSGLSAMTVSELSGCKAKESAASVWARTATDESRERRSKEMIRGVMDQCLMVSM